MTSPLHAVAACAALLTLATAPALAQPASRYQPPRLEDGRPDIQGLWTNASLTRLERAPGATSLVLSDADAAQLRAAMLSDRERDAQPTDPNAPALASGDSDGVGGYNRFWIDTGEDFARVNGEIRSSWIVDPTSGQVPYTPAARAAILQLFREFRNVDNPEARSAGERCTVGFGSTGGPPMLNVLYNNNYQIVQTPDTIAIVVEMNHNARLIRVNGARRAAGAAWLGDSIGRWDGDTLVVETTDFHQGVTFRADVLHRLYIPPSAKVEERFTRISANEILYQFSVDEPATYAQTWRAEMILRRSTERMFEYACHEGNYSLPNILAGARRQEQAARAGAARQQ